MSDGWEFQVNTGNPEADRQTIAGYEQQYRAQGMTVAAEPMPYGGFLVRIKRAAQPGFTGAGTMMMQQAAEAPAPIPAYGAPPLQQQYGAPQQQQ